MAATAAQLNGVQTFIGKPEPGSRITKTDDYRFIKARRAALKWANYARKRYNTEKALASVCPLAPAIQQEPVSPGHLSEFEDNELENGGYEILHLG